MNNIQHTGREKPVTVTGMLPDAGRNPVVTDVLGAARQLRASGKIQASFELVRDSRAGKVDASTVWQHQPFFWENIRGGNCVLTRRKGPDAVFMKALLGDSSFARRFHRMAARIPQQIEVMERILNSEHASLVSDTNSIHWIVRDSKLRPWGTMSLTNISLSHKRAEVLLGLLDNAPFGMGAAAMLLLFRFFFGQMGFHKLVSLTFDDNEHSRNGTLHLGFSIEGRLRGHFFDAATNRYVDMVQAGLLADEAFSPTNKRLMQRLHLN